MEIGSFLELQLPRGRELYVGDADVARLNSGRAAIYHAFRLTGCHTVWLPYYQCDTVREFLTRKGVALKFYHIDKNFLPTDLSQGAGEAVLFVNYYGVMAHARMRALVSRYENVIVDCSQAFFQEPIAGTFTVYSCRKFVGVPDGAYVVGKGAGRFVEEYEQCYSSDTALFLLQRIEYGCEGKAYASRSVNEHRIDSEDIMKMSPLTHRILDGTDYKEIQDKRRENFRIARSLFDGVNCLDVGGLCDGDVVPMVYPLVIENDDLLPLLQKHKHFQGHWWSYLLSEMAPTDFEYWLSRYIVPITIDQRYGERELFYLKDLMKKEGAI